MQWLLRCIGCHPRGQAFYPRGSIYTTIAESGPQNHKEDGLLGPRSIIVVYMDPLGMMRFQV